MFLLPSHVSPSRLQVYYVHWLRTNNTLASKQHRIVLHNILCTKLRVENNSMLFVVGRERRVTDVVGNRSTDQGRYSGTHNSIVQQSRGDPKKHFWRPTQVLRSPPK